MDRPIWTLPLSKYMINKLKKLGYERCEDLIDALGNICNLYIIFLKFTRVSQEINFFKLGLVFRNLYAIYYIWGIYFIIYRI